MYMNTVYVLPARTLSKKLFLKINLKLCIKTMPERLEHAHCSTVEVTTGYVLFILCTNARHIPLHPLFPWQAQCLAEIQIIFGTVWSKLNLFLTMTLHGQAQFSYCNRITVVL